MITTGWQGCKCQVFDMQERSPIVAGQFYPGGRNACLEEISACLAARKLPESLPETIVGAIVPHAGWTFSGSLAALAFSAIKQRHERVHTFIIFGAHYFGSLPLVYDTGRWITPIGEVDVDEELARIVLDSGHAVSDIGPHMSEHSIEVQVPFIKYLFPDSKILPILVPPKELAIALGNIIGDIIAETGSKKIICIASTDLTHYGPRYGFTPKGIGADALEWASEVNDRKFIDLALKLDVRSLLTSSMKSYNACGPGAAAAVVTVAKKLGKREGLLLGYTNSNEVMLQTMGTTSQDSVGYTAIIF
jgi:AmmeMemoRadiSam system protein B